MRKKNHKLLVGIDEAGRGPIAGPVSVGVFVFLNEKAGNHFRGVKECKQLSEEKREYWFEKIVEAKKANQIDFCAALESEKIIDKKGISYAIKSTLNKCLKKLKIDSESHRILLDGGLRAPISFKDQKTIIKGDEKKKVIALASICAKVTRDRYMRKMADKYPEYGFDIHKGYGTKVHYEAIRKHGKSPIHRESFLS